MLSLVNKHEKDKNILFIEDGHKYYIDGITTKIKSMTQVIHLYFPIFEPDKVIKKIKNGRNFHNSEYYGKTDNEIKEEWINAAKLGTEMHERIEDYFNDDLKIYPNTPEFGQFLEFWKDWCRIHPNLKPYRTEWKIYDKNKHVAGMIDFCLSDEHGNIVIIDWKRCKNLKMENSYEKGYGICSHIDSCNAQTYYLQLNGYRYVLETCYGKKVIGMYLAVFHPNQDKYKCITVPDRSNEISLIWESL